MVNYINIYFYQDMSYSDYLKLKVEISRTKKGFLVLATGKQLRNYGT